MDVPPLLGRLIDGTDFTIAEWVDDGESAADRPIAPLHVHDCDDEAWYVLEGALGFRCGDTTLHAPAGSAVLVPAGTPHSFWNSAGTRTRYLLVMTPRIAALVAALHETHEDIDELFGRFESRLVR